MAMQPLRIVVVGGGISGLAAAYRLKNRLSILGRPFETIVLEASPRPGGVVATQLQNGYVMEAGPDCFSSEKRRGIGLCEELGILRELIKTQEDHRRSFIAFKDKLVPVPTGFYLMAPSQLPFTLLSPLLSWKGKLRLLKEYWIPKQTEEDETLGSFVRRRFGQEVLERLAQP